VGPTLFTDSQRRPAPALAGTTIGGASLRLADLIGHGVVVLNVWASWCPPCRAESRTLAALSSSLATRGVRFVGLDEQDGPAKARSFAARAGMRYPSLSDPSGRMLAQLTEVPSGGIPSTVVIDRNGVIAGRVIGAVHAGSLSRLISRIDSGH
jgi:peroxiredoxin